MINDDKVIGVDVSYGPDFTVIDGIIQGPHVDEIQAHIHYMNNERFNNKFGEPSIKKLSEFELNYCLKKPSIFSKSIVSQKTSKKPYK